MSAPSPEVRYVTRQVVARPWRTKGFHHRQLRDEMITNSQFCYLGLGNSLYELPLDSWKPQARCSQWSANFWINPFLSQMVYTHEIQTLTKACLLRYHGQGNSKAGISKCLPKPTAVTLELFGFSASLFPSISTCDGEWQTSLCL